MLLKHSRVYMLCIEGVGILVFTSGQVGVKGGGAVPLVFGTFEMSESTTQTQLRFYLPNS